MEEETQQPIQQQQYQQPVQQQYFKVDRSEQKYVRFLQIGILLIMIGLIIAITVQGFTEMESGDIYDPFPTQEDWVNKVVTVGGIIYYIGLALLLMGLLGLALLTKEMHLYMKIALIITFAIVFGFGISGGLTFMISPFF